MGIDFKMAITIYEITIPNGYHQEPTYQAMIDYCNNNNLDVNDIVEKTVDEPDERQKWFKICDFEPIELEGLVLQYEPPVLSIEQLTNINFNFRGYFKKRNYAVGELRSVEYYRNYNPNTDIYDDLIVKEEFRYYRNSVTGECYLEERNIHWYLNTNEIGYSSMNIKKWYTPEESTKEIETRRSYLIAKSHTFIKEEIAKIYNDPTVVINYLVQLLSTVLEAENKYKNGIAEDLIVFLYQENNLINTIFPDNHAQIKQGLRDILIYDFLAEYP